LTCFRLQQDVSSHRATGRPILSCPLGLQFSNISGSMSVVKGHGVA
jgi:hypothetical protein